MIDINGYSYRISQRTKKTNYNHTVKQSATSQDVIKFIVEKVNEHSKTPFAHMVVKALSFGKPTRDEFIKRVFDYVCKSVDYLRDPIGKEVIFTPKLLLNRGKGDCKKQALFIATILSCRHRANIKSSFLFR